MVVMDGGGTGMLNGQQPSYTLVRTWLGTIKSKFVLFSSQHFGGLCNAWMEFYTFMQTCSLGGAQMLNNLTTLVFFSVLLLLIALFVVELIQGVQGVSVICVS